MSTSKDILDSFGLSYASGFLPHTAPLRRLPDPYFAPWEDAVTNLPDLVARRAVRSTVDKLPILEAAKLKDEPEWRRAYVILGFLTQAYIWSEDIPSERLPPQIAIPFLAVSKHHDLPPTATYSSLVLWNFAFQSPYCDLTDPGNLRSLLTVTGTKDEEWFYLISVALESRGGPIITTLLSCMDAVRHRDDAAVIASLAQTTLSIQKIDALLQRMHEHCDPQVYYHDMRPLLAGTKGMAASGLPKGVFFDEGEGRGEWHQYSGGSNGQSSLIQFLDIALGVDHYATGAPRGRSADDGVKSKANGYIQEMRRYMPGPHRSFLSYIDKTTNIRAYAHAPDTHAAVRTAYNDTLAALARFRDGHINIVTRYVITPSKAPPASYVKRTTGLNLASATSCGVREAMKAAAAAGKGEGEGESEGAAKQKRAKEDGLEMYGTGGTDLIPFLKQTRDETREAALPR